MRFLSIKNENKGSLQFDTLFDTGLTTFDDADMEEGVLCAHYHTEGLPVSYRYLGDTIDLFIVLGNEDIYCIGVADDRDGESQEFVVELNECEKIKLLLCLIKHLMK